MVEKFLPSIWIDRSKGISEAEFPFLLKNQEADFLMGVGFFVPFSLRRPVSGEWCRRRRYSAKTPQRLRGVGGR